MNLDFWRIVVSLGVPGLALGVLYMLFRRFNWQFPKVPRAWTGPIVVLFIIVIGLLVYAALYFWAPNRTSHENQSHYTAPESVLVQQRDDAEQLYYSVIEDYQIGVVTFSDIVNANLGFLGSELSLSSNSNSRITAHEKALKRAKFVEQMVNDFVKQGITRESVSIEARLHRQQIEIGLAAEKSAPLN